MFRRAREVGPVGLIPAAWTVVAAAHAGAVTTQTLLVAHVVMSSLLAAFAVTAYSDMREGTLRVWWTVIAAGFLAASAGTIGLRTGQPALRAVSLYGWMLLPAVGLLDTGRRLGRGAVVYLGGAGLCLAGAIGYAAAPLLPLADGVVHLAALAAVGTGQTAGILDAARRG